MIQACQGSKTDPGMKLVTKRSTIESDSTGVSLDSIPVEMGRREAMAQRGMSIDETDSVPYEGFKVSVVCLFIHL